MEILNIVNNLLEFLAVVSLFVVLLILLAVVWRKFCKWRIRQLTKNLTDSELARVLIHLSLEKQREIRQIINRPLMNDSTT